jgi:hypothetical protein
MKLPSNLQGMSDSLNHRMLICWCSYEVTGCVFSADGTEIVATLLNDYIYVFDVNRNYLNE